MPGIDKIDYTAWSDNTLKALAEQADTDNVKGLQGVEIFNFTKAAIENKVDKEDFYAQVGISLSQAAHVKSARASESDGSKKIKTSNPVFDAAVNYYNDKMGYYDRSSVTVNTYTNLEQRLHEFEQSIDQAYLACQAYQDIVIVPRGHYRFYPYWEDKLINFDIEDLRTRTTQDMESLHELRDKVEYIIEEANGTTEHHEPAKKDYDVDKLAQKYLGMSYEEFAEKYHDELEFCKTVTYADLASMTESQRFVYSRAKAYAKEMLNTTVNEAHTANWDIGERKLEETLSATENMYTISDFEYDGITEEGWAGIKSGIMRKAFEEALINKYRELDPDGVRDIEAEEKTGKPIKVIRNGTVLLFYPDGKICNVAGQRIK